MNVTLLGQGFEAISENSVGNHLIKFFSQNDFNTFIGLSAFVSQRAMEGIARHIDAAKKHLKSITLITGVDQKGTSKEALEAMLKLDVNSYVFYVSNTSSIFHPKIYLFEGEERSELIIGSSNMTQPGLFTNVETSLLISIDNKVAADREIVDQLKGYFKEIFDFSDPNLQKLSNDLIDNLVKANIVPTEAERRASQNKLEKPAGDDENIISKIFPKRVVAKIPEEFRSIAKSKVNREKVAAPGSVLDWEKEAAAYEPVLVRRRVAAREPVRESANLLVWESGALTERDLNVPKGENTNQTGSMLFKKGLLKGIDQRHYFRDKVFSSLHWIPDERPQTSHLERATAFFRLIILGENYGLFKLTLTHNTRTDTRSYEQKNSMTSVSWGDAKKYIAREELIGRNARLYKSNDKANEFILEIE